MKKMKVVQRTMVKPEPMDEDGNAIIRLMVKTVQNHHIPDFTHKDACWMSKLLPTAYHRLYVSHALFDESSLSSQELPGIIQELIKEFYDRDAGMYTVKGKTDPILLTVSPMHSQLGESADKYIFQVYN